MTSDLSIVWRCRDGTTLLSGADGSLSLKVDAKTRLELQPSSAMVSGALVKLENGADEVTLIAGLQSDDHAIALLFHYVGRLRRAGLLVADVRWHDRLLVTLQPRVKHFDIVLPPDRERTWQLSRFAYLHRQGDDLVLECPEAPCVAYLRSPETVAWLYGASRPTTLASGTAQARLLALLGELAFLVDPGNGEDDARQTWEFHDRLFHDRARVHDDFRPHGGTFRFRDRLPSPPAIRPAHGGESVPLVIAQRPASKPLFDVMEERRSRREMGERTITRRPPATEGFCRWRPRATEGFCRFERGIARVWLDGAVIGRLG